MPAPVRVDRAVIPIWRSVAHYVTSAYHFFAKQSRKSGKEMANDAPSYIKGKKKIPGKTAEESAVEYFEKEFGRAPTKKERGPGGPINQGKKYLDRHK